MRWFKRKPKDDWSLGFIIGAALVVMCVVTWDQVVKVRIPFIRLWRWCWGGCLPCGRMMGRGYRYCSLECAGYDGALRNPKKSWVLFGTLIEPKRHYESDMNEE
ncbi:MAG: hypothetical protein ACOYB3_01300 [Azonexus sp.]